MLISLRDMKAGEAGRVVSFDKSFKLYRQKLLAMGLTPGTEFTVIRIAPLGDPVEIRVRGTDLTLRRDEVAALKIEAIDRAPATQRQPQQEALTVAVIGNPNCGKTTLFNGLTGSRQHVGNWAGVTVEQKTGQYIYDNKVIKVVDLPGIYSLDVQDVTTSLDEKVARDYILSHQADLIINIIDTSHLEHNLYLTFQLLEMGLPIVIVLNNMDDASGRDIIIDSDEIARRLDCPLVSLIATKTKDIRQLKPTINRLAEEKQQSHSPAKYPEEIHTAINQLLPLIDKQTIDRDMNPYWLAVKLLERDGYATSLANTALNEKANQLYEQIETVTGEEADILIADSRYGFINTLTTDTLDQPSKAGHSLSDKIDKIILNRFLGIPIFFGIMYLMFTFTIKLGRAFKPFFNEIAQAIFVDGTSHFLGLMESPQWLITLFAGGIGNGIREVLAFVPILGFLYLFISVLEESGYMARATFVMDRFMRVLGLPGKAFVPMILGFGCNVPAMMATRTLERQRDRILNIIINPFMTCGARLAVFTLFAATFFPENGQYVIFSLYLLGVIVAILTALLFKNTFLKEEFSLVVMEIPDYHIPRLKNVLINSWTRIKAFIFRVGKIIIAMVLVLHILSSWGTDGSFNEHNIENSVLSAAGRTVTPVFAPMGINAENWPATVAVFTGVLHKVVVISTLKTIYTAADSSGQQQQENTFNLWTSIQKAFMTIPTGLKKMLGIGKEQMSNTSFSDALHAHFDGQIGAFAYLIFILLYAPCIATTAAAFKETNTGWTSFMVIWATVLAYLSATVFYQTMTYAQHPGITIAWLSGAALLCIFSVLGLRLMGHRQQSFS